MWKWLKRCFSREPQPYKHVCEEFTQWTTHKGNFTRPASLFENGSFSFQTGQETITFTRRWQERQCTICGKMQQIDLEQ